MKKRWRPLTARGEIMKIKNIKDLLITIALFVGAICLIAVRVIATVGIEGLQNVRLPQNVPNTWIGIGLMLGLGCLAFFLDCKWDIKELRNDPKTMVVLIIVTTICFIIALTTCVILNIR